MRYSTPIIKQTQSGLWNHPCAAVLLLTLSLLLGQCPHLSAASTTNAAPTEKTEITRLAIVQPESAINHQSPYYQVVNSVVSYPGINASLFNLTQHSNKKTVIQWLNKQNADAVLTLGRDGHDIARSLAINIPVIAGGLALNPNGISGISLCGQPEQFFQQLRSLTPRIKRVSIVYSESINGWWIEKARAQATAFELEFTPYRASSIREAVVHYESLIDKARPELDAIWIPLVDIVPAKTILPMVLKAAWNKQLVVFSNNPAHVKQGALFALYPNNESMGTQLAQLSITVARNPQHNEVKMADDLKMAFNQRTGAHLGVEISGRMLGRFDRVYPTQ